MNLLGTLCFAHSNLHILLYVTPLLAQSGSGVSSHLQTNARLVVWGSRDDGTGADWFGCLPFLSNI